MDEKWNRGTYLQDIYLTKGSIQNAYESIK